MTSLLAKWVLPLATGFAGFFGLFPESAALAQEVIYVAADGNRYGTGSVEDPLTFEVALSQLSQQLLEHGLPEGGHKLILRGGHYAFTKPFVLGPEFVGTAERPIRIQAQDGESVWFSGGIRLPASTFYPVLEADRTRLAAAAADKVVVAIVISPQVIQTLSRRVVTTLSIGDGIYLPSVFPNSGYASFADETAIAEMTPPAIPPGKEGYGIRAGHPPFQESGRKQGWLGSIDEPRGAWGRFSRREDEMAGTWAQWEAELKRNKRRCELSGYIDANWLLKSQAVVAASAELRAVHLSQALAYGWIWKQNDKPFKLFGLLCEVDQPGEWHFDTVENRLYVYPLEGFNDSTRINLPVSDGFMKLDRTQHVSVIGLSVENIGGGYAYSLTGGSNNLIAGAIIRNSPAGGVNMNGTNDRVQSCDLVDLESHVRLAGGKRGPGLLEAGGNTVENCHIYQKGFSHRKVSVSVTGVGNTLRHNLIHNSIGQAVVVSGNDHLIELNELFNIGYDEGDGGAIYSGADLIGYGNTYRHNFFHHLMHVPGKVERSGIHLDDCQAGSTCEGNVFYKSAAKGIFMFGGAGHTVVDNVFLEGFRGIYNVGTLGAKHYRWEQEIAADPNHKYQNTKENYLGRLQRVIGEKGWLKEPWKSKYPLMVEVLNDTGEFGRMWPIRCRIENNLFMGNARGDKTIWSRFDPEVAAKSILRGDRVISAEDFGDYEKMDFRFTTSDASFPAIPFEKIGLRFDAYRESVPDKSSYRLGIRKFYHGIGSMPGTNKQIDTATLVESGPWRNQKTKNM